MVMFHGRGQIRLLATPIATSPAVSSEAAAFPEVSLPSFHDAFTETPSSAQRHKNTRRAWRAAKAGDERPARARADSRMV